MKTKSESKVKKNLKLKRLTKSGESSLKKAVKNVTEILKKKEKDKKVQVKKEEKLKKKEQNLIKVGSTKKTKKITKPEAVPAVETKTERGVVYVGHIPHGFYEEQMKKYFSQFGKVTKVRISRSKNTGQSKGYGFVEFLHPEVAKIAAESMNNYLMFGRLVKTEYIPPEKQHGGYFKGGQWSMRNYPKLQKRQKSIKANNNSLPNKNHKVFVKKSIKNLSKLSNKLKAAGIDFNIKLGDVQI